jgi:hypothetical protein
MDERGGERLPLATTRYPKEALLDAGIRRAHDHLVTLKRYRATGDSQFLPPVVAIPWMNVRCVKKKSAMIGRVKRLEAAMSCAH